MIDDQDWDIMLVIKESLCNPGIDISDPLVHILALMDKTDFFFKRLLNFPVARLMKPCKIRAEYGGCCIDKSLVHKPKYVDT